MKIKIWKILFGIMDILMILRVLNPSNWYYYFDNSNNIILYSKFFLDILSISVLLTQFIIIFVWICESDFLCPLEKLGTKIKELLNYEIKIGGKK